MAEEQQQTLTDVDLMDPSAPLSIEHESFRLTLENAMAQLEADRAVFDEVEAEAGLDSLSLLPGDDEAAAWSADQLPAITSFDQHLFEKPASGIGLDVDTEDTGLVFQWRVGF